RLPAPTIYTPWIPMVNEDLNWQPANDPCVQLLGGGWRLPTSTEWTVADAAPQFWTKDQDTYNSVLKLHNAGVLEYNGGTIGTTRGTLGRYWSSSQFDRMMGASFQFNSTTSAVIAANSADAYKTYGYSIRCIRDVVTATVPMVSNVLTPVSGMKVSSAEGSATIVTDGKAAISGRGLVWSTTNKIPTLADQVLPAESVLPDGSLLGDFKQTLTGLSDGPTYYVRAYATNTIGTGYSPTATSFKICNPVTVVHAAGLNGAPVDRTITYGTVSTNFSGADARCWITQNLGADRQATSVTDGSEEAAGWYWQFNRIQGYKHDGSTRTPSNAWTAWTTSISEPYGWTAAQDPCMLLMGAGWRLPTSTEMNSVISAPQSWTTASALYNSVLKIHNAGSLTQVAPGNLAARGTSLLYWTSTHTINTPTFGKGLYFNGAFSVTDMDKANAMPVRCLRDEITATLPTIGNVIVPTATMTSNAAKAITTVGNSGGSPVTARGLVWSSTNPIPTISDQNIPDTGKSIGEFSGLMNGLEEGPTYYVRAYVETSLGLVYSPAVTSFKVCNPITVFHKAGFNGAAVDQTITYQTISTNVSGAPRCWLAQNLGASEQAKAVNDPSAAAAGWFWQFNRVQGYEVKTTTRLPATSIHTPWVPMFNEDAHWLPANDPCVQMLGGGWRLPTGTEWTVVDAAPQFWAKDQDAYNSVLKLHNAGLLENNGGTIGNTRGTFGRYWSSSQYDRMMGVSFQMNSTTSAVIAANNGDAYKSFGYSIRCIRDAVTVSLPMVTVVTLPLSGRKESSVEVAATVVNDGGNALSGCGLVWSTTNKIPTLADQVLPAGTMPGDFTQTLSGLSDGPTYYIRAYATNAIGTGYSPTMTSFKVCNPVTLSHVAGVNGAVANKTVTYGTVSASFNGDARCWITQNLGADRQAISVTDASEESAGWYWQFNRMQAYKHDGTTRTPSSAWIPNFNEQWEWTAAQDPCTLLMGRGWRMPTFIEMNSMLGPAQGWLTAPDIYNSVLKIHNAGSLTAAAPGNLVARGTGLNYWTGTNSSAYYAKALYFNGTFNVADQEKGNAYPVRCTQN
ncbi:hypothetical protein, partial [Pedobacter gandavensis]|uniref:hypothetical protein n=1 Tax=Pedobacter gandavensis TaxID=2679963 RepID=UPI00292D24CB